MSHVFTLGDLEDFSEKINLDELYEKKKQHDLSKLDIFNKLLNRIHTKIKVTSRQKVDEQFCWFLVPEVMIGVPKYDQGACISYLMDKLHTNGFVVKYMHPNVILISWKHWIPDYVRKEIKKKAGVNIDGYGNIVNKGEEKKEIENSGNNLILNRNTKITKSNDKKDFKSITDYTPSGNLLYNKDLLKKIESKVTQ
jgi:hypothetical protein